ncbi:hypothetical protein [Luteipulveratus halotolerans]|uniref:Uncharacterized protein n=1 Tax=Luteipulveratus halotolerans TaxID=1631356 RepID=A0A0L6CJ21_9MICO|nr:hypothetical protein [Luteipulveratus halotolerans]KNX37797.1 hypothetical protein VV01_12585 [Luteipulveratus halotolerans]
MAFTCDQYGRSRSGTAIKTVTGRTVCRSCDDRTTGMAAGIIAAGGSQTSPVASGIATAGFFERLRKRRRRD